MVCYNFMPILIDKNHLAMRLEDGSYALAYDENMIKDLKPEMMFDEWRRKRRLYSSRLGA